MYNINRTSNVKLCNERNFNMKLACKKFINFIAVMTLFLGLISGCAKSFAGTNIDINEPADTVVYGKVYTSNKNHDYAQAFAVKNGKYIYVGDEAGVKKYIKKGYTKVINKHEKGLITAGATEGHGHYVIAATMAYKNFMMTAGNEEEIVKYLKKHIEKNPNEKMYFTYGWDNVKLMPVKETIDIRSALDKVCKDKIVIMMDNTGHNCFLNSKAIEAAGFTPNTEIKGGFISKDANGRLLGLASDIATNYVVANVLAKQDFMTTKDFAGSVNIAENQLHSYGYTNYFDAYTSFFGEVAYKGLSEYDKNTGLTINMGASYKIDPFQDINKSINEVASFKEKYTTKHLMPDSVKLFADGECVESMSGWVLTPYKDGSTGTQVWATNVINNVVKIANQKGLSVHIHASGDAAVQQAVEAFIKSEKTAKNGIPNCIGHTRNVTEKVKDLMARHHIYSATNICWRLALRSQEDYIDKNFNRDFYMAGYPMKSLLKRGIIMTSSTDYPANSGAPCDMPSIIEMAVNGTVSNKLIPANQVFSLDENELITVEQALDVFTINGAKQLGIDKERGSIEVGKYADFIFLDKDITTSELNKIHNAKVDTVYFEGKKVYKRGVL